PRMARARPPRARARRRDALLRLERPLAREGLGGPRVVPQPSGGWASALVPKLPLGGALARFRIRTELLRALCAASPAGPLPGGARALRRARTRAGIHSDLRDGALGLRRRSDSRMAR